MVVGLPMPGRMVRGGAVQERWQTSTTRTITLIMVVVGGLGAWAGLVARKFGHRFLGAIIIDERLAGGGRGDERGRGGVVERPRQAQAGLVGLRRITEATVAELEARLEQAERWLARTV